MVNPREMNLEKSDWLERTVYNNTPNQGDKNDQKNFTPFSILEAP